MEADAAIQVDSSLNASQHPDADPFQDFVLHPDLDDDYRQKTTLSSIIRIISIFSLSIPESWKSVNKRKALELKAQHRVGFVFQHTR